MSMESTRASEEFKQFGEEEERSVAQWRIETRQKFSKNNQRQWQATPIKEESKEMPLAEEVPLKRRKIVHLATKPPNPPAQIVIDLDSETPKK